jgi:hypothetical protein
MVLLAAGADRVSSTTCANSTTTSLSNVFGQHLDAVRERRMPTRSELLPPLTKGVLWNAISLMPAFYQRLLQTRTIEWRG